MKNPGPAEPAWREQVGGDLLRARLFVVSYVPVIFMFAAMSSTWLSRIVWSLAGAWALVDAWRLTYGQLRKIAHRAVLTSVTDRGSSASGYLATYLLPFIAGPPEGVGDALAYGLYFAVAMIVYVRSDMVLINPTLYVVGWQLVEGRNSNGARMLLLCRSVPASGEDFDAVTLLDALVRKG